MTHNTEAARLREVLEKYADELCEGWCKENGGYFDDCSGCPARQALQSQPSEANAELVEALGQIGAWADDETYKEACARITQEAIDKLKRDLAALRTGQQIKALDSEQVRDRLRAACNGNQKAWAERHAISPAYVSDVLTGRREPGDAILRPLGLWRDVRYWPDESAAPQVETDTEQRTKENGWMTQREYQQTLKALERLGTLLRARTGQQGVE